MTGPVFSRSGRSSAFGKCTEMVKAKVPEDIKTDLAVVIRLSDKPNESEYIRDMITSHLYGSIPDDMKEIVWDYVEREIQTPLLRKMLRAAIFGHLHESSLVLAEKAVQGTKGALMGAEHED
jgi:hypothetical protein